MSDHFRQVPVFYEIIGINRQNGFLHYSRMVGKAMQALDAGAAALKHAFG